MSNIGIHVVCLAGGLGLVSNRCIHVGRVEETGMPALQNVYVYE